MKRTTGRADDTRSGRTILRSAIWLCEIRLEITVPISIITLPVEYCTILRDLLDKNPVSSYDKIEKVIIDELGASPDVLFKSFDRKPLSSASLAQVHTAIGHDGVKYAVKM